MRLSTTVYLLLSLLLSAQGLLYAQGGRSSSIKELEVQKKQISEQLTHLALPTLNTGVAPIGYRSNAVDAQDSVWVEINLQKPARVDLVAIFPAIWKNKEGHFEADAFPQSLRIMGRTAHSDELILLQEIPDSSIALPRIAPLLIPIDPVHELLSVRLEAVHPAQRAINGDFVLQLAELMLFEKERLVSLHQEITSVMPDLNNQGWDPKYLVDGITPFLMNANSGKSSTAFINESAFQGDPVITIDLLKPTAIDGIRFHTVEQGDTVPQAFAGNFGVPGRIVLSGSNDSQFRESTILLNNEHNCVTDNGPILQWNFPPSTFRYLRLNFDQLFIQKTAENDLKKIGFSEIEVLQEGRNILPGKPLLANFPGSAPEHTSALLNNSLNYHGHILSPRLWVNQLTARHDLTQQLEQVSAQLDQAYVGQEKRLYFVKWVLALVVFASITSFLLYRLHHVQRETLIRERIASNLHDELGANLHAINHLSELARSSLNRPQELDHLLGEIDVISQQTGTAARDCAHLLRNHHLCEDLIVDLQRHAQSLLADLEHEFDIIGKEHLQKLSRRTKIDLLLFFKEALINIIRHSRATSVEIYLTAETSPLLTRLTLQISDNGVGVPKLPPSLKRRARYLGATLTLDLDKKPGTALCLHLKKLRSPFTARRHPVSTTAQSHRPL